MEKNKTSKVESALNALSVHGITFPNIKTAPSGTLANIQSTTHTVISLGLEFDAQLAMFGHLKTLAEYCKKLMNRKAEKVAVQPVIRLMGLMKIDKSAMTDTDRERIKAQLEKILTNLPAILDGIAKK